MRHWLAFVRFSPFVGYKPGHAGLESDSDRFCNVIGWISLENVRLRMVVRPQPDDVT